MEININCVQMNGYFDATIDLDGTTNLDNPVNYDAVEPRDAIAGAVLEYLMKTGQLNISINGIKIEQKPEDETPHESFFDNDDWVWDNSIVK